MGGALGKVLGDEYVYSHRKVVIFVVRVVKCCLVPVFMIFYGSLLSCISSLFMLIIISFSVLNGSPVIFFPLPTECTVSLDHLTKLEQVSWIHGILRFQWTQNVHNLLH